MFNLFVKLYPIIPCILITVTLLLSYNAYEKIKNYISTDGEIIDFYKSTSEMAISNEATYSVSPVIMYTVNGREYKFKGNFYSASMKKGDKTEIMYNKENPEKAVIKKGLYFAPLITGILGVCSIFPVFIFRLIMRV